MQESIQDILDDASTNEPYITCLGPPGTTFSEQAYHWLATAYDAPKLVCDGPMRNCVPARANTEVLRRIAEHGGYGTIAIATQAKGHVDKVVYSFGRLLQEYAADTCPFHVVGAVRHRIHFCLMARPGIALTEIDTIIAHTEAIEPCKGNIRALAVRTEEADTSGEAARRVAELDTYRLSAALAPQSAADTYGLSVLNAAFEDTPAHTTFLLLAPKKHRVSVGICNRVLLVFKLSHVPLAMVNALKPFGETGLNMTMIHDIPVPGELYDFMIELDVPESKVGAYQEALLVAARFMEVHISFGPFEVLST
jgi:prephenate dehydratase